MPLYGPKGGWEQFFLSGGTHSPAAATSYYVALNVGAVLTGVPVTTAPTAPGIGTPEVQAPCLITRIELVVVRTGTAGTLGQFGSMAVLVNNTTATTPTAFSGTLEWNAVTTALTAGSAASPLNIPMTKGDYYTLRVTTPAVWTTPATNVSYAIYVYGINL